MTTQQLIRKIKKTEVQKIGKAPVVVLPLKVWQEIQDSLEDLQLAGSRLLTRKISKARLERKVYSVAQVKKSLSVGWL